MVLFFRAQTANTGTVAIAWSPLLLFFLLVRNLLPLYFPTFLKPKIRFFCHFFVKSSPHGAKMLPRRHSGTLELKGAVSFASVITDSLTHSTFRPIFFNLNTITHNRNFPTYQHKISIMSEHRVAHHRPCGCTLMRLEVRTHT